MIYHKGDRVTFGPKSSFRRDPREGIIVFAQKGTVGGKVYSEFRFEGSNITKT